MWEYVKVVTGAQYKHYFHLGQNINVTCGTEYNHYFRDMVMWEYNMLATLRPAGGDLP